MEVASGRRSRGAQLSQPVPVVPVLRVEELSKKFGSTYALQDVGLQIAPGEIHGLLGQNGSGKSTLVKILAGFHAPESGALVAINGQEMPLPMNASDIRRQGVAFVHQDLGLIPELSVAENFALAEIATSRRIRIRWPDIRRRAAEALDEFDVRLHVDQRVRDLAPVERALVAIARALTNLQDAHWEISGGRSPCLLVLDEPTAFLGKDSAGRLGEFLQLLVKARDSVLLVSHSLAEVQALTHRVTVLRDGRCVAETATAAVSKADLIQMIVGRQVMTATGRPVDAPSAGSINEPDDAVKISLTGGGKMNQLTLTLLPGAVVGVTGLRSSGWEDVPYLLFGVKPGTGKIQSSQGSVDMKGLTPRQALDMGFGLVPADRASQGCIGELSVAENLSMLVLKRHIVKGFLRKSQVHQDAQRLLARYEVRPADPDLPLGQLSGGNQQKVLLAKWIDRHPRLLLLHEPTQGVDVGARQQIFEILLDLAAAGTRILIASSDQEELAHLCSKVVIIADGGAVVTLEGADLTEQAITEACLSTERGRLSNEEHHPQREGEACDGNGRETASSRGRLEGTRPRG